MPVVLLKSAIMTDGCIVTGGCVAIERIKTDGRIVAAGCKAEERITHPQQCCHRDSLRLVPEEPLELLAKTQSRRVRA